MITNKKIENVLQNLVNKLEMIEKDQYVQDLHKFVFSLWKEELEEARKALKESKKPPIVLCTGYSTGRSKQIDLFDVQQLDLPLKHEDEL